MATIQDAFQPFLLSRLLFGLSETESKVGTAFRPDAFWRSRRARGVKDGRRPLRIDARKACVLDGSEHRGTSPTVEGGLLCLSVPPAPSPCALGVPFGGESDLPGLLDGPQPCQLGLCQLRKAS